MSDPTRYTLTITEGQAQVLVDALDLYSRIHIGQFERILDPIQFGPLLEGKSHAEWDTLRNLLQWAHELVTGSRAGGPGIHNSKEVDDLARVSYDLQQVIRHRLWQDRNDINKGLGSVDARPPLRSSATEGLATIERVEP